MSTTNAKSSMSTFTPLEEAAKTAPDTMGCYQIYYKGRLVYVGKAEAGLRKRFVQYQNGTTKTYASASFIDLYKKDIAVKWAVLDTKEAVRVCESRWIETYKPLWNSQSGWGSSESLKATSYPTKVGDVKIMSPELAIADCFGNAIKSSVAGAVGTTACVEVVKSIVNGDDPDECIGNVVSKSVEVAVSTTGAAVAGEAAAFTAVALGAGPVGMAVAGAGAALVAGAAIGEAVKDEFDDVKYAVSDAVDNVLGGVFEAVDNVGGFFSDLFGGWF